MEPYYEQDGIRIFHGDCREVLSTLDVENSVLIGDPPYGINATLGMGGGSKGNGGMWKGVAIDGDKNTDVRDFACGCFKNWAVCGALRICAPAGTKAFIIWDKGLHTGAGDLRLPWKPHCEFVFVGGDKWQGTRSSSILQINAVAGCVGNNNNGHRFHTFEKPVALMRYFISASILPHVVDAFMGSGTTLVAAKLEGKQATGIEIEEKYCEIAANRLRQGVLF